MMDEISVGGILKNGCHYHVENAIFQLKKHSVYVCLLRDIGISWRIFLSLLTGKTSVPEIEKPLRLNGFLLGDWLVLSSGIGFFLSLSGIEFVPLPLVTGLFVFLSLGLFNDLCLISRYVSLTPVSLKKTLFISLYLVLDWSVFRWPNLLLCTYNSEVLKFLFPCVCWIISIKIDIIMLAQIVDTGNFLLSNKYCCVSEHKCDGQRSQQTLDNEKPSVFFQVLKNDCNM